MFASQWMVSSVDGCGSPTGAYTIATMQDCTQVNVPFPFTGLTISGADVTQLNTIANHTCSSVGYIRVLSTSLVTLNGVPSADTYTPKQLVRELTIDNNPMLTSFAGIQLANVAWVFLRRLPLISSLDTLLTGIPSSQAYNFGGLNAFLEVSECPLITTIAAPSYTWNFGLKISNNAALQSVAGFDYTGMPTFPPPSFVYPMYSAVEISNNPELTTLSVYSSTTAVTSIILRNNSKLATGGGIGIPTITGSAIISDNLAMTVLGTKFTSVNQLYLERNPNLADWTSLYRFTTLPSVFSVTGSACPSFTFFQTPSIFTRTSFIGCQDLLKVTFVSVLSGPVTGGTETWITVDGILAEETFNATFVADAEPLLSQQTVCVAVSSSMTQFRCIVPATNSGPSTATIRIRVSTSRPWIVATNFQFTFVSVATHFGADLQNTDQHDSIYAAPFVKASTTGLPGLPASQTIETTQRTNIVIIFLGVFILCFVVFALVLSVCCDHHRHCSELLDYLILIDAFKIIQEDRYHLNKTDHGYVMRRQGSRVGGTMAVAVVLITLGIVSVALINYFMDNIAKSDIQQPVDDPPTAFASSYSATLLSHGSHACVIDQGAGACDPQLSVSVSGFKTLTNGDGLTCAKLINGCRIQYNCGDCTMSSTAATLQISDSSSNAYALSFSFMVTSIDYLGQLSLASANVSAISGSVMKGSGNPALGTVTLTPAQLDNFGTVSVGVLSKAIGTSPGNQLSLSQFGADRGVGFTLNIAANQNARFITLSQKSNAFETAGATAGLVSGVMAVASMLTWIIVKIKERRGLATIDISAAPPPPSSCSSLSPTTLELPPV